MDPGSKSSKELTSWKEIAAFLGVSERTAQHWERKLGLPVQRVPGPRGRVLAEPAELENWKKSLMLKRGKGHEAWHASIRFLRSYAAIATVLAIIGTAVLARSYFIEEHPGPPARHRIDYRSFIVEDAAGHEIWRTLLPERFLMPHYLPDPSYRMPVWFGDLDGDGGTETLLLYDPVDRDKAGCMLICYSDTGAEKWRFVPGGTVSDKVQTFSGSFIMTNFLVADPNRDGKKEILATSHHPCLYPNQFVVLDVKGDTLGEYWHSGFLEIVDTWDMDSDGVDEILLANVNNGYHEATLIVLDPRRVAGTSTQPEGDYHQLQGLERGKEKAVVLFPRSPINLLSEEFNLVRSLVINGETIRVEVVEKRDDFACSINYTLDRHLMPLYVEASDRYKAVHRQLELAGKLPRFSEQQTEQLKKEIRIIKYK